MPPHRLRRLFAGLLLVLPLLAALLPPGAQAQSPVSADSILSVARDLSGETGIGPPSRFGPLPSTSNYLVYLREQLERRLAPLGGFAYLDTFYPGFDYDGPQVIREAYANVVGVVPGALGPSGPGCVMLGAHLDATSQRDGVNDESWDPFTAPAPGADDNASGVSAILEAVRVLGERGRRPQADLLVVFFDGEEQQLVEPSRFLLGSGYMADSLAAAAKTLYGFVNLDMVAFNPRGADSLVVLTNGRSRWLADCLIGAADDSLDGDVLSDRLALTRVVRGIGFSDHGPFWDAGYDAVLLIEAINIEQFAPHYHRGTDTVDNVFTNNGSQAAAAADLVLRLAARWGETGSPDLRIDEDDLLIANGLEVDAPQVTVGDTVQVQVGVVNHGGNSESPYTLVVSLETTDGQLLRELSTLMPSSGLPAGGHRRDTVPWIVASGEAGAVNVVATLDPGTASAQRAVKPVAVEQPGGGIVRAYVFPNPTHDVQSAVFHYELAEGGPVRLSVIDLQGQVLGTVDRSFDPVFPGPDVNPGQARVPLRDILGSGTRLAPGLFFVRVELFNSEGGGTRAVELAKFAVVR